MQTAVRYSECTYTNGDILGCCKRPIENKADERCVQPVLRGELGEQRIRHALGHDDETDGDTCGC